MMEGLLLLGSGFFLFALIFGFIGTPLLISYLRKKEVWKVDVKKTMYGTEAKEFKALREKYAQDKTCIPEVNIPRLGGVTFFPVILVVLFFSFWFPISETLRVILLLLVGVSLFALYDDLRDIGKLPGGPIPFVPRLGILFLIALISGFALQGTLQDTVTLLPVPVFSNMEFGVFFAVMFALWVVFWQLSSIIDGIDGLAGSIFLTLFIGTGVVSLLQGQAEPYVLSSLGIGLIIPFLFFNYAPAKIYLTEVGITILVALYASITFLLATGVESGVGIWTGLVFGLVLIGTWVSNILQLLYRKKTGKKLFRIAPIHHHFEALGMSRRKILRIYTTITAVLVALPLFFMFVL